MAQLIQIPFVRQEGFKGVTAMATLSFHFDGGPLDHGEAMARVRRAVTAWVSSTEDGAASWWASCEDFNVGDLSLHANDVSLQPYLEAEGITGLDVATMDCDQLEDFDLVLPEPPFEREAADG